MPLLRSSARGDTGRQAPRPLIGEGRCRGRLTGGVEAGDRSKGRGFATSFARLPAEISGVVSGEVSPDPSLPSLPYSLHLNPTPYPLPTPTPYTLNPTPSSDVGDVGGEASSGRLLSPASSSPVRCPRQRCALLPKQKNIRARGGWRRMRDWGGRGAPRPLI